MIIPFDGKHPRIGRGVFIAPTATVIGDVKVGDGASIWYGTVVRGDTDPIVIGRDTSIQDNSTVHSDHGFPTVIGSEVTVGHNALVHGCTIENGCLVGNGAQVLNGAIVRSGLDRSRRSSRTRGHGDRARLFGRRSPRGREACPQRAGPLAAAACDRALP